MERVGGGGGWRGDRVSDSFEWLGGLRDGWLSGWLMEERVRGFSVWTGFGVVGAVVAVNCVVRLFGLVRLGLWRATLANSGVLGQF